MNRNKLISLLHNYAPSEEELTYKQEILNFIATHPTCFERSLTIGHITASAWLLNHDQTKALLMHHAKLDSWFQLGGHCDGESDVLSIAIKEAQEESGINNIIPISPDIFDIDIHLIPKNPREQEHYHYDVRFLLKVNSNEQVQQNNESKELRWISQKYNELPTQERSVARMFDKWCAL